MEKKLILMLSTINPDNRDNLIGLLNRIKHWDIFLEHVMHHKVGGLIFYNIKMLELFDFIPRYVLIYLNRLYIENLTKKDILINTLIDINTKCQQSAIEMIVLKGMALQIRLYQIAGLRSYEDIDLLIKDKKDFPKIHALLTELGFVQGEEIFDGNVYEIKGEKHTIKPLSKKRLTGYEEELQHYGEYRKKSGNFLYPVINLDIHHRLTTKFDEYEFDINDIFATSIRENEFRFMSNEYQLIHTATHIYWHTRSIRDLINLRDNQLKDYLDINELLKQYGNNLNFNKMKDICMNKKVSFPVAYSLYNTWKIFDLPLVKELFELIKPEEFEDNYNGISDRWVFKNDKNFAYWNDNILERMFNYKRADYALRKFYSTTIDKDLLME